MNAVYPLGTGSKNNNIEIRYSVSSLKYAKGVEGIFVVGENPGFGTHIPYRETQLPAVNIWEKLVTACMDERISDPFLFINDDHYFIQEVDALNYPNYYCYKISEYPFINHPRFKISENPYYRLVDRTKKILGDVLFFNVHCPCIIHKDKFLETFTKYRNEIYTDEGLLVKTTYLQGESGVQISDYKTRMNESLLSIEHKCKDRHIFSSAELFYPQVAQFLESKNIKPFNIF